MFILRTLLQMRIHVCKVIFNIIQQGHVIMSYRQLQTTLPTKTFKVVSVRMLYDVPRATMSCYVPKARMSYDVPKARMSCPKGKMSCYVQKARMSCSVPKARMSNYVPRARMWYYVPRARMWYYVPRARTSYYDPSESMSCHVQRAGFHICHNVSQGQGCPTNPTGKDVILHTNGKDVKWSPIDKEWINIQKQHADCIDTLRGPSNLSTKQTINS